VLAVERDAEGVAYAAAHAFWQAVDAALTERPSFRVALAGGRTPTGLYHELVRQRPGGAVWRRLQFFFGDERAVGPEHPDSNYRMAKGAIFDHAPVSPEQIHRMPGELRPLDAAARAYEKTLAGEPFDLVLLGVGVDGHTASLFPGSPTLEEKSRWVLPVTAPAGNAVRERLTITLPCIASARAAWFLVTGSEKARVVARVLSDNDAMLPAARVRATRVVWFLDRAAAAGVVSP
jgi:6-phosphogluconolactonase